MIFAKRFLINIFFAILFLNCGTNRETEDEKRFSDKRVIIKTSAHTLTLGDVHKKYKNIELENVQDEYKKKKRHLELSLERFLHIEAAREAGLSFEMDSSTIRSYLNQQLYIHDAAITADITDSEVRQYFKKYGGEIQFGVLVVPDSALMDSIYERLESGGDWDKLVLEYSTMKLGKKRGGSRGYVPFGQYDEQTQSKAYDLDYGQYTKPFRSKYGWSMVMSYDRIKHSNEDLEREWNRYKTIASRYSQMLQTDEYKKKIMEDYNYKINWDIVDLMAQVSDSIKSAGSLPKDMPSSAYLQYQGFSSETLKRKIVSYTGEGFTIRDYLDIMESFNPYRSPELQDKYVMEFFCKGYARDHILVDRALKLKVDTLRAYKDALIEHEENWLIQEYNKQLMGGVKTATDEDIQKYYEEHPDDFFRPEQIRVSAISLKTEKEAQKLLQRLKSGANFGVMARKYSTDKKTASLGGDFNFFTVKRFTEIYNAAAGMEISQLGGPVKMYGNYWVFKVTKRLTRERRPIRLVKSDISSRINANRRIEAIRELVNKNKETAEYFIDFDLLRNDLGIVEEDTLNSAVEIEGTQ